MKRKNLDDLNNLSDILNTVLNDMKTDKAERFKEFMSEPIAIIKYSRGRTSIQLNKCTSIEAEVMVNDVVGYLLNMIPKEDRQSVVKEALKSCTSQKGMLYETNE